MMTDETTDTIASNPPPALTLPPGPPAALGRLERVDLRAAWLSEGGGFTPWLASDENIRLLGETIGIDLEVEAQEKSVGPFRADILCKDTAADQWVLIENQLEVTDHVHLGQLLTYAAGLHAVTIVWVAKRFTDEHRATLDWLNEITDERFNFFGLEVELWQIDHSRPAPKFNVISKPNDWSRSVTGAATQLARGEASPRAQRYVQYWSAFGEYLRSRGSRFRPPKPRVDYWTDWGVFGRAGFKLTAYAAMRDRWIGVSLYLSGPEAKSRFRRLEADRQEVERVIGAPLIWDEKPGHKEAEMNLRRDADPADSSAWPEQHAWLVQYLERFEQTFRDRIRLLDAPTAPSADGARDEEPE